MGEVVTHPEPGTIDYVSDGNMLNRVGTAGTNVIINGRYREHVARISQKDFSSLMFGSIPAVEGRLEGLVPSYVDTNTPQWAEFMATRKVVRRENPDGTGEYSIAPNVELDEGSSAIPKVNKPRMYTLANIFSDSHIADKYGLSAKVMNAAKTMAISQPDEAARALQGAMRQLAQDERIRVVAGPYSRSRQQCKFTVRNIAGKYAAVSASIHANVSGRKIMLFGPEGEKDWMVCGPLHHVDEVYDVYRMVWHVGTSDPMFLLGLELTVLDIDIHNGKFFECPTIEGHAGGEDFSLPANSSFETMERLGAAERATLASMVDRILPVHDEFARVVASSVRVTAKHVLQSEHVMQAHPNSTVGGMQVVPIRSLGRDLWVSRLDGPSVAWRLRAPVIGEEAVICYSVGHEVQVSSPMRVESADGYNILLSRVADVVPGMSGGALIGLHDFALLGIHNGSTLRHNLCSQFGQQQYTDLCDADIASQACCDEASATNSDNLYDRYKRKGLASVVDHVIMSSVPLYSGDKHVAMSVHNSGAVYTTFDVGKASVRVGEGRLASVFEPAPVYGQFKASVSLPSAKSPLVYRNPEYYEKVVLVGRDALGPYFSDEMTVVDIGVSHRSFSLSHMQREPDLPLIGAVVIALSDAAVLGQFYRRTINVGTGDVYLCLPLRPEFNIRVEDPVEVLQSAFPFLHVATWQEGVVEEVISHPSRQLYESGRVFNSGNLPLARIGSLTAQAQLGLKMREAAVPYSRWNSETMTIQSNAAFAEVAWKWGIAKLVRTAPGVVLSATSAAYADVVTALVGAVYINENSEVFEKFCQTLGVVAGSPTTPKQFDL